MNSLSNIISNISLDKTCKVLYTSICSEHLLELIERFIPLYKSGTIEDKIDCILNYNIWGFESDTELFEKCIDSIYKKWGFIPLGHNLRNIDYLLFNIRIEFDYIIGNRYNKVDEYYISQLNKIFGRRDKYKIKNDILSYTIVKSVELLSEDGKIILLCPKSLLYNKDLEGLRRFMFSSGLSTITNNSNDIITLEYNISNNGVIIIDGCKLDNNIIDLTPNFNWSIDTSISSLFTGKTLDEYLYFYDGYSINKEYFIKKVSNNKISEQYKYEIYEDITLNDGGKSKNKYESRKFREVHNNIITNIFINKIDPYNIDIPNSEYVYYNIPSIDIVYSNLDNVIVWEDDGEIVKTYHNFKNIHFVKDGITWQSKYSTIRPRYINSCVSDIGSPVCELKQNLNIGELYFIMAWLISDKCNSIIKSINKKNNIQIKDIKNLPYPTWVSDDDKLLISDYIKNIISEKKSGVVINDSEIIDKINLYF